MTSSGSTPARERAARSPRLSQAPMHVLVVAGEYNSPTDDISGAFIQPQLRALAEIGCKVGVVYPELRGATQVGLSGWRRVLFPMWDRRIEGVQEMGVEGLAVPKSRTLSRTLWDRQAVRLGRAYAERHGRPDIVHAHFSFVAGPAAYELAERFSAPLVITEHYSGFLTWSVMPFDRDRTIKALARSAAVLAVGEALSKAIQRFAPHGVRVLPNVVHRDFFATSLHRQSETTFNILSVGGLRPAKGFDVLLKAFRAAFPNAHDSVRLRICGEGGERKNLESLIRSLALEDRAVLVGARSRTQICREVEECDLFVSSSRVETFGVSVIEALAAGRPVVSTRSGGPEYNVTADNGLLCPLGDVDALAACLREVRAARERWRSSASQIREGARGLYSAEVFAGRLVGIYKDVLAERAGMPG
jgi:glycosyltransferase involved in cell wall biosynthesis